MIFLAVIHVIMQASLSLKNNRDIRHILYRRSASSPDQQPWIISNVGVTVLITIGPKWEEGTQGQKCKLRGELIHIAYEWCHSHWNVSFQGLKILCDPLVLVKSVGCNDEAMSLIG